MAQIVILVKINSSRIILDTCWLPNTRTYSCSLGYISI